jgi:hypothetical protein
MRREVPLAVRRAPAVALTAPLGWGGVSPVATSTSTDPRPIRARASGTITVSWWLDVGEDFIEEYSRHGGDPRELLQTMTLSCPHDGQQRGLELAHTPGARVVRARCPDGHIWDTEISPYSFLEYVASVDNAGEPIT